MLRLTQEDLSQMSGIGMRTIHQIETSTGNPSYRTLEMLFSVLGLDFSVHIKDTKSCKEGPYTGAYGQSSFRELARRLGIPERRTERILTQMLFSRDKVRNMVTRSFLSEQAKEI